MHTTIWGAASSFGLVTASAMASKLHRDLQRYRNAKTTDDRRDAAINGAITAWHMCEWVWAGITSHDRHGAEVSAFLGVAGRSMERADVQNWAEKECPSLKTCRAICNGSKHVISDRDILTKMTAPDPSERGPGKQLVANAFVEVDGELIPMGDVLSQVVYFWGLQVTSEGAMR